MVDTILNQTVTSPELHDAYYYLSAIPRYLTQQITNFLTSMNVPVNTRTVSLILAFISLGMVYLGIKVLQKVNILIKIILVSIGILIFIGLFIPW